jgi:precorrin-2 dehydrogenase/sirohydrochlorin ferrochelatase
MGGVMLPVFLDLSKVPVLLVGRGDVAEKRANELHKSSGHIFEYKDYIDDSLAERAKIILITGLPPEEARRVAEQARALGKIVHVEDDIPHCDFFLASTVRRGDLTIAVSTGGKSPALARLIRRYLEALFDARWGAWLARISAARHAWREAGESARGITEKTQELVCAEAMQPLAGWLAEVRSQKTEIST